MGRELPNCSFLHPGLSHKRFKEPSWTPPNSRVPTLSSLRGHHTRADARYAEPPSPENPIVFIDSIGDSLSPGGSRRAPSS